MSLGILDVESACNHATLLRYRAVTSSESNQLSWLAMPVSVWRYPAPTSVRKQCGTIHGVDSCPNWEWMLEFALRGLQAKSVMGPKANIITDSIPDAKGCRLGSGQSVTYLSHDNTEMVTETSTVQLGIEIVFFWYIVATVTGPRTTTNQAMVSLNTP